MKLDPKNFRSGELYRPPGYYDHYLHFIERVEPKGVWIELVYQPYKYERHGEVTTVYTKLAGHGCLIEHAKTGAHSRFHFGSVFWDEHTPVGYLPRLVGERSLSISVPM